MDTRKDGTADVPHCAKCGKELEVGYPCEACWSHEVWMAKYVNAIIDRVPFPTRDVVGSVTFTPSDAPLPVDVGWICPKCGSVNSPNLMQCYCTQYKVTCGSNCCKEK
jgi:hypothetical protein